MFLPQLKLLHPILSFQFCFSFLLMPTANIMTQMCIFIGIYILVIHNISTHVLKDKLPPLKVQFLIPGSLMKSLLIGFYSVGKA